MAFDPKHRRGSDREQNDIASEDGALHGAVRDVMQSTGILENGAGW